MSAFTDAAEGHATALEVIDVPDGQHAFDMLDHTDASRGAVTRAMAWAEATLTR